METFNKRLLAIIDESGLRKASFARELGIEPHGISAYIKENGSLFGGAILANFSVKFPQFSLVWLLTGQGEMYNVGFERPKKAEGSSESFEELKATLEKVLNRLAVLESYVFRQTDSTVEPLKYKAKPLSNSVTTTLGKRCSQRV